ncbi:MAG: S8 family serine peptidase [Actinomycetota bacterium]
MSLSRRRRSLGALVTVISLLGGTLMPLPTAGASLDDGPAFVEPKVRNALGRTSALVHVEKEARVADALAAAERAGLDTGTLYEAIKVFVAYGDAAGFERLSASPTIEWIQANRNARLFTNSSHKATRGQELLDGGVTLPDGTRLDGRGIGIAVVDSGIDGTHPDLVTRMGGNVKIICSVPVPIGWAPIGGFQECRGPKTAVPMSDTDHPSAGGHGTHVAGTIAGTGTASNGLYHGAAPGATLYGVSVGTTINVENGLDGLAWVLENHDAVTPAIRVVNNSWGSGYSRYQANGDPLYDATWKLQDALIAAGVTVVFAAGNSGGSGTAPTTSAQCINPRPGLICVANYDDKGTGTRAGTINSSSSRGKADQPENWPDLSAPGTSITATCRWTLPVCHGNLGFVATPPNSYAVMTGTSMAAPHVAGIVAQVLQADPTLTPAAIENLLEDTAYKFAWGSAYGLYTDPTNPDDASSFEKGHGLVDAVAAVQAALGGGIDPDPTPSATATPTPTPTPTPTETSTPPTGIGATYYFHSASGLNTMDQTVGAEKPSFDAKFPTFDEYSVAYDVPGTQATTTTAAVDPIWHGQLGTAASTLSVDLWQKIQPAHALGSAHYNVRVFTGGTFYDLFPLLDKDDMPLGGNSVTRIQHTFTKMRPSGSTETDVSKLPALSLPAGPLSIAIRGYYIVDDALTEIRFDSKTYPSGFSVNGGTTGPEPPPTPTPDPTPTETTDPNPGGGRGTYPTNPDDPLFADQWGMTKIKAPEAWQEKNATGYGVKIAIVDSGVDLGHEDFACSGKLQVLPGSNIGGSGQPQDQDGHGTHVAGIAGACTNNGKGVVGVAPDATIMPVRVFDEPDLDKAMADGIRFATDNGAHVINLSIGDIPPFSHLGPDGYPQTEEAMEYARNAGVVIAAAAGNFAQPTCEYPSLSRNVICVVATDRNDMRSYYTDFPVNIDRNADEPGLEPVVAAPGGQGTFCDEGVASTYLRTEDSVCYTTGYESLDGTSMSSPHVAGIAALMYDRLGGERSRANADRIVQGILDSADDLYTPGWDPIVGYGRVNALQAVRTIEVVEPTPTGTPTETPTEDPGPAATTLSFTDNSSESGQYTDTASLEALLTATDTGAPIEGAEVVFEITGSSGTRSLSAVTDAAGVARSDVQILEQPGQYVLTARYAGDEENHAGSADSMGFVVDREDSSTAVSLNGTSKAPTVVATLTDADDAATGLAGRTVEFFVDGRSLGTAVTNGSGVASLDVPKKDAKKADVYSAVFAGDTYFVGSSGTTRT